MNEIQNKETLKATLEAIRSAKYPDIPADLVSRLVDIQSQDHLNISKAYKLIKEEIISYLSNKSE